MLKVTWQALNSHAVPFNGHGGGHDQQAEAGVWIRVYIQIPQVNFMKILRLQGVLRSFLRHQSFDNKAPLPGPPGGGRALLTKILDGDCQQPLGLSLRASVSY